MQLLPSLKSCHKQLIKPHFTQRLKISWRIDVEKAFSIKAISLRMSNMSLSRIYENESDYLFDVE